MSKSIVLKMVSTGLFLSIGSPSAHAAIVTYQFSVTGVFGPLADVETTGFFSIDDSLAPPPGEDFIADNGLLTSLSFTWNGTHYDTSNINTAGLEFDASGEYSSLLFGNNCDAPFCTLNSEQDTWHIAVGFNVLSGRLDYTYPTEPGFFLSNVTLTRVPIPATLILLLGAVGSLGMLRQGETDPQ